MQNRWSLNFSHFYELGLKQAIRRASRYRQIAKTDLYLCLVTSFDDCSFIVGARCLLGLLFFVLLIRFIGFVFFGWFVFVVKNSWGGCLLKNTKVELLNFLVNIFPLRLALFALLLWLSTVTFATLFVTKWLPNVNVVTFPLTWAFSISLFDFIFLAWHYLALPFFSFISEINLIL